jgi:hypothetical protein
MRFLDKIGIGKKKKEEKKEEVVTAPQPSRLQKVASVMQKLNRPIGSGLGFNLAPKRSLMERQLGIPEYVEPRERAKNFIRDPKPVPKPKETIIDWRPRPGVRNRKGETW